VTRDAAARFGIRGVPRMAFELLAQASCGTARTSRRRPGPNSQRVRVLRRVGRMRIVARAAGAFPLRKTVRSREMPR
jgi:hypothetical protein